MSREKAPAKTFIGGYNGPGPRWMPMQITLIIPFAKLEVSDDAIIVSARSPFRWVFASIVVYRSSDVRLIPIQNSIFNSGIEIVITPYERFYFWTLHPGELVEELSFRGFNVVRKKFL